jgi:hypothetical protein
MGTTIRRPGESEFFIFSWSMSSRDDFGSRKLDTYMAVSTVAPMRSTNVLTLAVMLVMGRQGQDYKDANLVFTQAYLRSGRLRLAGA